MLDLAKISFLLLQNSVIIMQTWSNHYLAKDFFQTDTDEEFSILSFLVQELVFLVVQVFVNQEAMVQKDLDELFSIQLQQSLLKQFFVNLQ